jgi:hypothetical protein
MLSCRTNDENFRCLKYLGRMRDSNFSLFLTMKLLPLSVQLIASLFSLSYVGQASYLENLEGFVDECGYLVLLGDLLATFKVGSTWQ